MKAYRNQLFKVVNVVNNNIVTIRNFDGREMIAIGKGLGFKKRKGDIVYPDEISKSYVLVDKQKKNILSTVEEIPFDVIEVSQQIIDVASKHLNQTFNVNLLVALADHINFSVEEFRKGNVFPKLVNEEVKRFYKNEYEVGLEGVKIINEKFNVNLDKDEATSIAFHLITATENTSNQNATKLLHNIRDIISIVEKNLGQSLDENSMAYSRFVIHLKFFMGSIVNNTTSKNNNEIGMIFDQLKTKYEGVSACVNEISDYIYKQFNYRCTDEDCIYLMIHIVRIYELIKGETNGKN